MARVGTHVNAQFMISFYSHIYKRRFQNFFYYYYYFFYSHIYIHVNAQFILIKLIKFLSEIARKHGLNVIHYI